MEEKLTHKVLAGFYDDFVMNGLGLLDVLLDEVVNVFVAIHAVANLDGVTMIAQMNASSLSGVIAVDVDILAWHNAMHLGGSLQILHIRVDPKGNGPPTWMGSLVNPSKSISLTGEVR